MPALRALALFCLLLPGTLFAQIDTCTTLGSGNWTAICTLSGAGFDCTGGDSTCDANDTFVVDDGHTVTVGGDLVQTATDASAGISVPGTGIFRVLTPGVDVQVGPNGIRCTGAASTCLLQGTYREFGVASPGTSSQRQPWYAGDFLYCPDTGASACNGAGDPNEVRIDYSAAKFDDANGQTNHDAFIPDALAEISAGDDVLCWHDFNERDDVVPADALFCYPITAADATGFSISVAQGTSDPAGYPLAWRTIVQSTLTANAVVGQRTFTLACDDADTTEPSCHADDATSGGGIYVGRWLRFEDGSNEPAQDTAYKIVRTSWAADVLTVEIEDPRGLAKAYSSGDAVWIDYGHRTGDTFFIMDPVRVTSSTAALTDSPVIMEGFAGIRAVWLDHLGISDTQAGNGDATLVLEDAELSNLFALNSRLQDLYVLDGGSEANARRVKLHGTPGLYDGIYISGQSATGDDHGLYLDSCVGCRIQNASVQYVGDDCFGDEDASSASYDRVHCRFIFANGEGASGQFMDLAPGTSGTATVTDAVCDACTTDDANGSFFGGDTAGEDATFTNVVIWGATTHFLNTTGVPTFRNLYMTGLRDDNPAPATARNLLPERVNGCYIHGIDTSGFAGAFAFAPADNDHVIRNCLISDIVLDAGALFAIEQDTILKNVAFLDVGSAACATSNCTLLGIQHDADNPDGGSVEAAFTGSIRNVTVALREGSTKSIEAGFGSFSGTVQSYGLVLDDLIIAHLGRTPATLLGGIGVSSLTINTPTWGNVCLFDNQPNDYWNNNIPTVGAIRDKNPRFVDLDRYKANAAQDYPCRGAQNAGIRRSNWALQKSGIPPVHSGGIGEVGGGGAAGDVKWY